jgi:adenine-specific DNA-methyltransferase
MTTNLDKLKILLAELFMLDQADLDFGIYRVMNAKRAEVTRFLDHDLLPQVRTELEKIQSGDRAGLETELAKAIAAARAAGFSAEQAEQSPKVKELRSQLAATVDVSVLENEVLSDLSNFFRRYYSGGDFLALRRYKAGVYAIPYEGEEVKLHWANADQYYIKTSEFLRDYTFKLADGKRIHFKLVEADTEADNKKSAAGQERRFILCANDPLLETDGELVIRFEYRPDADKRKQAELNTLAGETILNVPGFTAWKSAMARLAPTEKNPGRTLLEKHLGDYTARNSFDYFIHKDIGGFLRRELDFYIKNEIMHLDDIEAEDAPRVGQYLAKIKAIRAIARKIIDFLEQLENFQKKLWLKKKFVVETNYCVTLDRVAETLYPEIAANDAQWQEWEKLFAISEIAPDLFNQKKQSHDATFLKANPFLVLDTKFFPVEFKEKLLADNNILGGAATLDEATVGLLINADNFQGLQFLQEVYRNKIGCVHIDPPYNTNSSGFLYKNSYQHSSWLSMMNDRIGLAARLLRDPGVFACHIDEYEFERLSLLLERTSLLAAGTLVWDKGMPVTGANGLATQHEYVAFGTKGNADIRVRKKNIQAIRSKVAELLIKHKTPSKEAIAEYRKWLKSQAGFSESERTYDQFDLTGEAFRSDNVSATERRTDPKFYIPLKHPVTGKNCPVPDFGFRYTPETLQNLINECLVLFGESEATMPRKKTYLKDTADSQMPSIFKSGSRGKNDLDQLGYEFPFAHPVDFYRHIIDASSEGRDTILDFFGGSGTTAHAVISLNRDSDVKRKFVLIEMGDHFTTVMKPRIQKVIYSKDWKDGKPVSREGSSYLFKYIRLESYEDALNNLELKRTEAQDDLLRQHAPLREDYLLRYQLDVESAGSASLLAVAQFANPFAYQLKIATGSVGESRAVNVDLVETFNYLLGLRVSHADTIRGFKVVTGLNPTGEKTLVIWRIVANKSNADLDAFFQKQGYNTKDMEFAVIYVNGDNNLENLKRADETWKVRRTEDEFKRLMFDVQDV